MNSHVVFTVGRFNPPTRGHGALFSKVLEVAESLDCDYRIFTTKTNDEDKNPLTLEDKKYFLSKFFSHPIEETVNVFYAARSLAKEGYTHGTLIVGSDHGLDIVSQLERYIDHANPLHDIGLKAVYGISVDRTLLEVSGTQVREFAAKGDFKNFNLSVPESDPETIASLYRKVRNGLGIENEHRHIR